MKIIKVKAVVMRDATGEHWFIHGASDEDPSAMFKAMAPLWGFNPAEEAVHYVEFELTVPEMEAQAIGPFTFEQSQPIGT